MNGGDNQMSFIKQGILLLLLWSATSINQTCSLIQPCPSNADCSPLTNYCLCVPGYIANCLTKADSLAQYPQLIELNPYTRQLFYIKPIALNEFIEITITICREKDRQNVPIILSLWAEDGLITQYLDSNALAHSVEVSFDSQCKMHTLKFMEFGVQPNGQSEMLVLGVAGNQHKTILSLTAQQKVVQGVNFYYYIMIGLIVFIVALSIVSGLTLVSRRRRWMSFFRSQAYIIDNSPNLDHLDIFMPSVAATKEAEKIVCPICLQNIQVKEEIRNTPCQHTFHTACLDSWCATHLSCPVCRSDFSVQKIGEIGRIPERLGQKRERELQEVVEVQLQSREPRKQMRQQMLE